MYNKVRILYFGRNKSETTGEETSLTTSIALLVAQFQLMRIQGVQMLMADIRVVQIVRNGDYSTGNIIITINQLLVVVQRAQLLARIIIVL